MSKEWRIITDGTADGTKVWDGATGEVILCGVQVMLSTERSHHEGGWCDSSINLDMRIKLPAGRG